MNQQNLNKPLIRVALIALLLLLSACAVPARTVEAPPPEPAPEDPLWTPPPAPAWTELPPQPYDPGKGDESMQRDQVFIESREIQVLEGDPPQYRLQVKGALPGSCHELRAVVNDPDETSQIQVQMWSLVDPSAADCVPALKPFEAAIPLLRIPAEGTFTVFLNGEKVGQIGP